MARIGIIGLGLIGGSIGLAVKRARPENVEVRGYDADRDITRRARRDGAIDSDAADIAAAVEGAGIVVVATPIHAMAKVFEEVAPALTEGAVVTDTASTKREVLRWAAEALPESANFVGGHPMAGKERGGLAAAEASLFEGRPWAVIPSVHASEEAVRAVENLVTLTGARPVIIDAEEHDSYVAGVSHLPLIVSTALFSLASQSQGWPELSLLAGPGFVDITRLASTDASLSHNICLTNRDNIVHWLDRLLEQLRRLRELLEGDEREEELYKAFVQAEEDREAFLQAPKERTPPGQEMEAVSSAERMRTFLIGEYLTRRMAEIEEMVKRSAREDEELRRKLEGR